MEQCASMVTRLRAPSLGLDAEASGVVSHGRRKIGRAFCAGKGDGKVPNLLEAVLRQGAVDTAASALLLCSFAVPGTVHAGVLPEVRTSQYDDMVSIVDTRAGNDHRSISNQLLSHYEVIKPVSAPSPRAQKLALVRQAALVMAQQEPSIAQQATPQASPSKGPEVPIPDIFSDGITSVRPPSYLEDTPLEIPRVVGPSSPGGQKPQAGPYTDGPVLLAAYQPEAPSTPSIGGLLRPVAAVTEAPAGPRTKTNAKGQEPSASHGPLEPMAPEVMLSDYAALKRVLPLSSYEQMALEVQLAASADEGEEAKEKVESKSEGIKKIFGGIFESRTEPAKPVLMNGSKSVLNDLEALGKPAKLEPVEDAIPEPTVEETVQQLVAGVGGILGALVGVYALVVQRQGGQVLSVAAAASVVSNTVKDWVTGTLPMAPAVAIAAGQVKVKNVDEVGMSQTIKVRTRRMGQEKETLVEVPAGDASKTPWQKVVAFIRDIGSVCLALLRTVKSWISSMIAGGNGKSGSGQTVRRRSGPNTVAANGAASSVSGQVVVGESVGANGTATSLPNGGPIASSISGERIVEENSTQGGTGGNLPSGSKAASAESQPGTPLPTIVAA